MFWLLLFRFRRTYRIRLCLILLFIYLFIYLFILLGKIALTNSTVDSLLTDTSIRQTRP